MWERIKLSANYTTALATIDEQLLHWPKFLIHKVSGCSIPSGEGRAALHEAGSRREESVDCTCTLDSTCPRS